MVAVVYSGSKNSFWQISNNGQLVAKCTIASLNPNFADKNQITAMLHKTTVLINYAESIKKIHVFAAGAHTKPKQQFIKEVLFQFFINAKIKVKDDLTGAAIAACGDETGIVGVLGSGANCAFYNGKKTEFNNFGLGYILADEGSSNYLGKLLLKNYLEEKIPADLAKKITEKYSLDRPTVLEKIYKKPNVQSYLSSFFDFFIENRKNKYIQDLICGAVEKYIDIFVKPMAAKHPNQPIHIVGLVAGSFTEEIEDVAKREGLIIKSIIKEPINNLLKYYSN